MIRKEGVLGVLGGIISLGIMAGASAEAAPACLSGNTAGVVKVVSGDVMVTTREGLRAARAGDRLGAGASLITGTKGRATVFFGGKAVSVPQNSSLELFLKANRVCYEVATVTAGGSSHAAGYPAAAGSQVVAGSTTASAAQAAPGAAAGGAAAGGAGGAAGGAAAGGAAAGGAAAAGAAAAGTGLAISAPMIVGGVVLVGGAVAAAVAVASEDKKASD